MVKVKEQPEYERLEEILRNLCTKYGYKLFVAGWARKTFDVFEEQREMRRLDPLVRVESLATSNGEIQIFAERAQAFAQELGAELEQAFPIGEAVLVRANPPGY